jgi:transmembrane sensor
MQQNIQVNDEVLVKYLLGEATDAEIAKVQEWIALSEANKKYFGNFSLIWNESKKLAANSTVDVEEAWGRFKARTQAAEQVAPRTIEFPVRKISWMRAAAMIVVLIGASLLVYNLAFDSGKMMAVNSGNAVLTDTLPDGSIVTLNKNSSLTYNSKLNGKIRSVKLEGEAFFNVAPDKEHPFVIDVDGNTVTVVGTSFNVKSGEGKTEVIVETGVVDVAKHNNKVTLHPNEKATILLNNDAPIKESNDDELYNYYKTKEFVCRNTSLAKLAEVLSEAYGQTIIVENERVGSVPITTTFEFTSDLDAAFRVLERHGFRVSKAGDKYILQ